MTGHAFTDGELAVAAGVLLVVFGMVVGIGYGLFRFVKWIISKR